MKILLLLMYHLQHKNWTICVVFKFWLIELSYNVYNIAVNDIGYVIKLFILLLLHFQ